MKVTGQMWSNGMKSLKYEQLYIYIYIIPNIKRTPLGYNNEIKVHARYQKN